MVVEDDCSAQHPLHRKAVGEKQGQGEAVIAEERRQVPGVVGVLATVGVKVGQGVGEGIVGISRAAGPAVDVKAKDPPLAGEVGIGQAVDLGIDEDAPAGLVKAHRAGYAGVVRVAGELCEGLGPAAQEGEQLGPGEAAGGGVVHMRASLKSAFHMSSYAEWEEKASARSN